MRQIIFTFLLIGFLLAGCAGPAPQATSQTEVETPAPSATGTIPTAMADETAVPTDSPQPAETQTPVDPTAGSPAGPSGWIAYIGVDSNLWLVNRADGQRRQLTQDAAGWQNNAQGANPVINYFSPRWSSDGGLLAFIREQGIPVESGYQFSYALLLYNLQADEQRVLLDAEQIGGFAWQPGAHLIAYTLPPDINYYMRQGPNTELAQGVWALDVDRGDRYELVAPERGFTLMQPRWSPDGRFLSFEEVIYMEGSGDFAYYDVPAQEYVAWDRPVGLYSWSPDGETIAYDYLTYTPDGSEYIHQNNRQGSDERDLSPDYEPGYAFSPLFSPQGDQLAYQAQLSGPESTQYTLFVMTLPDSEPRSLGEFEQLREVSWAPDGSRLIFTAGPFEQQQVLEVVAADGSVNALAQGNQPAWQPSVP